jgi:hypothetical protein
MELKSSLLDCFTCDKKHTAVNLVQELKLVTHEWSIENQVVPVVSDNAANVVVAVRLTDWKHVPCFAHTLNPIVQYGLQSIKGLHTKVKSRVEFFRSGPRASSTVKAMQEQLGGPALSLKQDVVTRWNSTYDMLQRIFDVKKVTHANNSHQLS